MSVLQHSKKEPSPEQLTSEVLAAQAADGNEEAFAQLVTRMLPLIQRLAARYRWPQADAEDLAQEGLLGLLSAVNSYHADAGASFSTYASVCIRNRMSSFVRQEDRSPDRLSEELQPEETPDGGQADPAELLQEREDARRLDSRLKKRLTSLEYEVLIRYLAAYSYEETARQLNISTKAVDNAIQRVRRKLSSGLGR